MENKKELLVELENVSKIFDKKIWAIKKINLRIYKGEGISIIGPNQSGKTVLGRLIANQIPQTSGIIEYNFTREYALSSIGFQFRQTAWPDGFTVRDVIELYKGIYDIKDEEWLDKLFTTFEINNRLDKRLATCAVSWLQLFSLFLAFLHKPELVVLDEVSNTIGLDMKTKVIEFLKNYKKDHNATYVIVSPDKSIFQALCDRIVVMEMGLILSDDYIDETTLNFDYDEYAYKILAAIEAKQTTLKPDPVFKPILKKFEKYLEKFNADYEKLNSKEEILDFFDTDKILVMVKNINFYIQEMHTKFITVASSGLNRLLIEELKVSIKNVINKIKELSKTWKKHREAYKWKSYLDKFIQKIKPFFLYLKTDFYPIFKNKRTIIYENENTGELSKQELTKLRFLKKKYIQEEIRIMKLEAKILKRQQKLRTFGDAKDIEQKELEKALEQEIENTQSEEIVVGE
ncbi:ATP-binding cassette domain-containing protein [Spiroplasma tabanidicola]|uniref:ABC transporter ATP-binding protein n=1 Tax=Spiroplasma tabanidicola TaxID=324079 RepID=A0A6I6CJ96_9MOLU|nr:ATP-binding cassette domain-containing protein [Spiroplasma tabanidicola]QGS52143.1 ABC transporter ATP-binding protein [Spiroplasma tabanidicola]